MAGPFALCGEVERRLVEYDVPAVSVAVLTDGELACRTWGARTFDGEAITDRTVFQAGSVSKPVTAVGVLRLVAEGMLDLDADVNEYLTTWKVPPVGRWQPRVTLRQLLTHTAGLTVHGFPGYARDARLPTLAQILDGVAPANTQPVRVAMLPGLTWKYSGGGTTIVQAAMVDATGESFSDLMRRLVLEPCGMTDATFDQPLPDDWHGRAAIGHRGTTSVLGGWHVYPEMAAAGLWCSPTDLMQFVREVNRAVAGEARAILPKALGALLVRPITAPLPDGGMAIGFRLNGPAPHRWFSHDGMDEGFLSTLRAATDGSCAIAVMANSLSARPMMNHVIDMVATAMSWPNVNAGQASSTFATIFDPIAAVCATYRTADGREFRIEFSAEFGWYLTADSQAPLPLEQLTPTHLTSALRCDVVLELQDNQVARIIVRQAGQELTATRLAPNTPRPSSPTCSPITR